MTNTKDSVADVNATKISQRMLEWRANHVKIEKPSWDETFISIANIMSARSADSQTKIGAVIVNGAHHVVACGYNGHVSGINDEELPNIRPLKYPVILHAEENALLACEHRPVGCTIYITGFPCLHCLQLIAQSGITEIVWDSSKDIKMIEAQSIDLEIMKGLLKDKVKIREYKKNT